MGKDDKHEVLEEFIKMLREITSETVQSKTMKITLDDVEFDEQGRVIIKNPEIAEKLKSLLEEGNEIPIGEGVNGGCLNIGCS